MYFSTSDTFYYFTNYSQKQVNSNYRKIITLCYLLFEVVKKGPLVAPRGISARNYTFYNTCANGDNGYNIRR